MKAPTRVLGWTPPLRPGAAFTLPALFLIGALFVAPIVELAFVSFGEEQASLDSYRELFGEWAYGTILLRTVLLSLAVTAGTLVFGYPIGYVLALARPRTRILLSLLVLLPFWTSVLVRNFAWVYLLRDEGFLSAAAGVLSFSGEPMRLLYDEFGVVIGMTGTLLPFMVFPVFVSILVQDRLLTDAAASLGANPSRVFFRITLPLSLPGVAAGSLLVFAIANGFFITPAVLGGGRTLVTATFITQQVEKFVNWPLAAAASMVLLAVVVVLVELYRRVMDEVRNAQ